MPSGAWLCQTRNHSHQIVKPGQIVKVKVLAVDTVRQRISLTMRIDDVPEATEQPKIHTVHKETGKDNRQPRRASRQPQVASRVDKSTSVSALALALARAREKK